MKDNFKINDEINIKKIHNGRRNKMKDSITLKGDMVIERRRKDGTVIDKEEVKNLIVNTGKERVAKLIGILETGIVGFTHIGIGESGTGDSVAVGDTGLVSESVRESATRSYEASYKAVFENTFTFATGVSYGIKEAGLFDGATPTGSVMLDRFLFSEKLVDSDTDLYIKITITVA